MCKMWRGVASSSGKINMSHMMATPQHRSIERRSPEISLARMRFPCLAPKARVRILNNTLLTMLSVA